MILTCTRSAGAALAICCATLVAQDPTLEFAGDLVVHAVVAGAPRDEHRVPAGTMLRPGQQAGAGASATAHELTAVANASVRLGTLAHGTTMTLRASGQHGLGPPLGVVTRETGVDVDLRLHLPASQRTRWRIEITHALLRTGGAGFVCPELAIDAGDDGSAEVVRSCFPGTGSVSLRVVTLANDFPVRIRAGALMESQVTSTPDEFTCDLDLVCTPETLADFRTFGAGCAGSNGTPELRAAPDSWPRAGSLFHLELLSLPRGPGVAFGFASAWPPGAAFPLALDPIGMTGCLQQLLPPPHVSWMFVADQRADWYLPIPNLSAILDLGFATQGFVVDPLANPFGATVTNGGHGIVGS